MSVRSMVSWPVRLALDLKERRFAALQNIICFLGTTARLGGHSQKYSSS